VLSRAFLILLQPKGRARLLLLVSLFAALTWRWAPVPLDWWIRPGLAAAVFALLGALEPMLIVMVAAEAGARLGVPSCTGYLVGAGAATAAVSVALERWRLHSDRIPASIGTILLIVAGVSAPATLLNAAAAIVLAPLGTKILLPRKRGGAPTLVTLLGGFYVFFYGLIVQFVVLQIHRRLLRRPMEQLRIAARRGMDGLFRNYPLGWYDLSAVDEIDLKDPAIVVSNHQSSVDIMLVLGLHADVRLTTSPRVWDQPWLGYSARALGHVRVDENILESAQQVLDEGASVHFFPEGTRSRDGYPARFRRGAFELAVRLQRDVVPLVLCGSRDVAPRDAYWIENFRLRIRALDRVPPGDDSRALQKKVQAMVREAFDEEMERLQPIDYLRRKVRRAYRYQGWRVGSEARRLLRMEKERPTRPTGPDATIDDAGLGVHALLLAECFPGVRLDLRGWHPLARHALASHPKVTFGENASGPAPGSAPEPPRKTPPATPSPE
jgi:1-acyl-sn-glycerol-3-phosphate acyltransferase